MSTQTALRETIQPSCSKDLNLSNVHGSSAKVVKVTLTGGLGEAPRRQGPEASIAEAAPITGQKVVVTRPRKACGLQIREGNADRRASPSCQADCNAFLERLI